MYLIDARARNPSGVFVMAVDSHNYAGHKLATLLIASIPAFTIDGNELMNRFILAVCGGIGSAIALAVDRPGSWQDGALRMGVGFAVCALFVPYMAQWWANKTSTETSLDTVIALAGLIGIGSWYLMGSAFRFLKWLQNSDVIGTIIKIKTGIGPSAPPVVVEKKSDTVVVSVPTPKPALNVTEHTS
jgi:hypothetical protein